MQSQSLADVLSEAESKGIITSDQRRALDSQAKHTLPRTAPLVAERALVAVLGTVAALTAGLTNSRNDVAVTSMLLVAGLLVVGAGLAARKQSDRIGLDIALSGLAFLSTLGVATGTYLTWWAGVVPVVLAWATLGVSMPPSVRIIVMVLYWISFSEFLGGLAVVGVRAPASGLLLLALASGFVLLSVARLNVSVTARRWLELSAGGLGVVLFAGGIVSLFSATIPGALLLVGAGLLLMTTSALRLGAMQRYRAWQAKMASAKPKSNGMVKPMR